MSNVDPNKALFGFYFNQRRISNYGIRPENVKANKFIDNETSIKEPPVS